MRLTHCTAAALLAVLPFQAAFAEAQPKHSVRDKRIQTAVYYADEVFPAARWRQCTSRHGRHRRMESCHQRAQHHF